jgi:citrate lyase beta subunit
VARKIDYPLRFASLGKGVIALGGKMVESKMVDGLDLDMAEAVLAKAQQIARKDN